ncbi:MAG: hypothetical protein RMJ46_05070 [Bacteroidota bacterium]|nr:hypothetical protein [Bacteroidota bacterium]
MLADSILVTGVRYQHYRLVGSTERQLRVLRVDLQQPSLEVKFIPALPGRRETLADIVQRYDTLHPPFRILAAVNGYFWSRFGILPVGLAATDGELLQAQRYKRWSTLVLDARGRMRLDTFLLELWARFPGGYRVPLHAVNRRTDTMGIVLYTRFAGDTIPRHSPMVVSLPDEENPDSLVLHSVPVGYYRAGSVEAATALPALSVFEWSPALPAPGL